MYISHTWENIFNFIGEYKEYSYISIVGPWHMWQSCNYNSDVKQVWVKFCVAFSQTCNLSEILVFMVCVDSGNCVNFTISKILFPANFKPKCKVHEYQKKYPYYITRYWYKCRFVISMVRARKKNSAQIFFFVDDFFDQLLQGFNTKYEQTSNAMVSTLLPFYLTFFVKHTLNWFIIINHAVTFFAIRDCHFSNPEPPIFNLSKKYTPKPKLQICRNHQKKS